MYSRFIYRILFGLNLGYVLVTVAVHMGRVYCGALLFLTIRSDRYPTPDGQKGNIMNGGTGCLKSDDFNILLSLRLARPPDDSPTKVIVEFVQTLQKAEPKAHIPPQMK